MTRSFGKPVTCLDELKQAISTHAARGAEKMRHHGVIAGRIRVFMHTNKYRKTPQFYGTECGSLRPYTNDTRQIIREAMRLTEIVFRGGIEYGKCGIILEDLLPAGEKPQDLFSEDMPHSSNLMKALDSINKRHGRNTLQMVGMGMNKKWKQRSERRSPCYTTRIDDVPIVRAI